MKGCSMLAAQILRSVLFKTFALCAVVAFATARADEETAIEINLGVIYLNPTAARIATIAKSAGEMPRPLSDGSYAAVTSFLKANVDDASSLEYVRWSGISPGEIRRTDVAETLTPAWGLRLRYRSRNKFGALELFEQVFFISKGSVIRAPYASGLRVPYGSFPGEGGLRRIGADEDAQRKLEDALLNPAGISPAPATPPKDRIPMGLDVLGTAKEADAEAVVRRITYDHRGGALRLYDTPYGVVVHPLRIGETDSGMEIFPVDKGAKTVEDFANRPAVTVEYRSGKITSVLWEEAPLRRGSPAKGEEEDNTEVGFRVFRDASGRNEIKAQLIGTVAGRAILKREDGKEIVVKLSDLSEVDRLWIATSEGLSDE